MPDFYRQVRILIYVQIFFLAINLPFTYTNKFNYAANIAFDVMRVFALVYSIYIAIYLIAKNKKKDPDCGGAFFSTKLYFYNCYRRYVNTTF